MTRSSLIILAGGQGRRLAGLKLGVPKPLAPVGGVPFLFLLLRHLRACGFRSALVAISRASARIQDTVKNGRAVGIVVYYFRIPERPYGTGSAILQARQRLTRTFYVMNGDTYITFNPHELETAHTQHQAGVTLGMVPKANAARYGSLRVTRDQRVRQFVEKGDRGPGLVSTGVLLVNQDVLASFPKTEDSSLEHDILPQLAREGFVYGHRVRGTFWDIGTPSSYRAFLRAARGRQ